MSVQTSTEINEGKKNVNSDTDSSKVCTVTNSSIDSFFLLDISNIEITDEDIAWMVGDSDLPPTSLYYVYEIDLNFDSLDELSDLDMQDMGVISDSETYDSS